MLNNYLNEHLEMIQQEYLQLLKSAKEKLESPDFYLIIDEINLFWFSNRNLIKLILANISQNLDCYVFTGATFLDIKDFEHYPFITFAEVHIIDDPLCRYAYIGAKIKEGGFVDTLKEQIILTTNDNITILEEYSFAISILPISLLSDDNTKLIISKSEQAFLELFANEEMTMEKYFNSFNSYDEICNSLKIGVENSLMFNGWSDFKVDLLTRIKQFQDSFGNPFKDFNEAQIFHSIVNGFFHQALEILFRCVEYNLVPYLRSEVTFHYFISLSSNFKSEKIIQEMIFKCACAHIFYNNFDKSKIKNFSLEYYIRLLKEGDFEVSISNALKDLNNTLVEGSIKTISQVLDSEFNKIIDSNAT